MIPDSNRVLDEAMKLPARERARLVAQLLVSLDEEPDDEVDVEAAWAIELERRAERILAGEGEFEDWEVVRERLRPRR